MDNINSSAFHEAINNFRNFVRIPTISSSGPLNGTYNQAIQFLKDLAIKYNFKTKIHSCDKNRPILIVTSVGTNVNSSSILFNCHYDVIFYHNYIAFNNNVLSNNVLSNNVLVTMH